SRICSPGNYSGDPCRQSTVLDDQGQCGIYCRRVNWFVGSAPSLLFLPVTRGSMSSDRKNPGVTVENTIPVLAVADVRASIRFYCDNLDFKLDWQGDADPPHIASVSRDGHPIMLQLRFGKGSGRTPALTWPSDRRTSAMPWR